MRLIARLVISPLVSEVRQSAAGAGLGAAHLGAAPLGVTLGLVTPRHMASLASTQGNCEFAILGEDPTSASTLSLLPSAAVTAGGELCKLCGQLRRSQDANTRNGPGAFCLSLTVEIRYQQSGKVILSEKI